MGWTAPLIEAKDHRSLLVSCPISSFIKLDFLRRMVASPVRGGVMWPRAKPWERRPPPPSVPPPPLGGGGGRDALKTHGCRRGPNYVARQGGLTYAANVGYTTLACAPR